MQGISTDAIDALVQTYEQDIGPLKGARVVARAWLDADFKARLLADGANTIAEVGIEPSGNQLVVIGATRSLAPDAVTRACCAFGCIRWLPFYTLETSTS